MPQRAPRRCRARRRDSRTALSPGAPGFVPGAGTTRTRRSWPPPLLRRLSIRRRLWRYVRFATNSSQWGLPLNRIAEDPPLGRVRRPAGGGYPRENDRKIPGSVVPLVLDREMHVLRDRAAAVRHHDAQGIRAIWDSQRAPGETCGAVVSVETVRDDALC